MGEINYLLDENVNPILRFALLQSEPDLTIRQVGIPNAPQLGTLDPEILIWCEENGFILVTNNRRSMPVHLSEHLAMGCHTPGIFILNSEFSVGETVSELVLIALASDAKNYYNQITYLPVK